MADISISDSFGATANAKIKDSSPFALSDLQHLNFTNLPVVSEFNKPIDETTLEMAEFGVTVHSPSILIGNAGTLLIKAGETGTLRIRRSGDKKLFEDDEFSPTVAIGPDDCWIGLALDTSLDGGLSATVDGFGVGIEVIPQVSLGTYILLQRSAGKFPTLLDGVRSLLERYSVAYTADLVRALPPGTVNVVEVGGTVKFTGSYSLPITVNALASAALPFNYKIELNPAEPLKIGGEIDLIGDFIVRFHKVTDNQLDLGVYKKHGTKFTASLTAKAGVEGDIGTTDVVAAVLNAVLPGVDPKNSGITGENAEAIRDVLKDCIDHSLSVAMNVSCSAAVTDEAAVVYSLRLDQGSNVATNAAISSALRGDWTLIDRLPNATPIRNIVKETKESKNKIGVNLLGIYNAASVDDYVRSCAILRDENGITITDKAKATHIAAADTPYAANPDKLRAALAEGFLTTMTYTAGTANGGTKLKANLTASQTYLKYAEKMPQQQMEDQVRLGRALSLIRDEQWDEVVATTPSFSHVKVAATAAYDATASSRLFFSDAAGRTPRTREDLETIGRDVLISLINPSEPSATARINTLNSDALWKAMDENGNVQSFQTTIPGLGQLSVNEFGAVSVDWTDIIWWAKAMVQVAPKLSDLWAAVEQSTAADPTTDANFMKKRKALADALVDATHNARAAFADGWGLAVMFAVSGGAGAVNMDIAWNSKSEHYESAPKVAAAP